MPKSYDEYAENEGAVRTGSCAAFFDKHPELVEEIRTAREYPPANWADLHAWLVTEYGYTLKDPKGITAYLKTRS